MKVFRVAGLSYTRACGGCGRYPYMNKVLSISCLSFVLWAFFRKLKSRPKDFPPVTNLHFLVKYDDGDIYLQI